jgi:hypothetical protein
VHTSAEALAAGEKHIAELGVVSPRRENVGPLQERFPSFAEFQKRINEET